MICLVQQHYMSIFGRHTLGRIKENPTRLISARQGKEVWELRAVKVNCGVSVIIPDQQKFSRDCK